MKSSHSKYRFGFLGLGRMAEVILQGLLRQKIASPKDILVSRRLAPALKKIARKYKVATTQDNHQIANECHFIWIGLKPFQVPHALDKLKESLNPRATILSMMAGVSIRTLRKHLGKKIPIIRLMPNTPALLGEGATGLYFSPQTPIKTRSLVKKILNSLGETITVSRERDLDAVTGLSGSGPAFVYTLVQGMIEGGVKSGLNVAQSRHLTLQTFLGAVKLLRKSGEKSQTLIHHVVSKGGTTEAGLKELKKAKTAQSISRAVQAATRRSSQIRKELE